MLALYATAALAQPAVPEPPIPPAPPAVPEAPAPPQVPLPPRFEADDELVFGAPMNDVFGMGGAVTIDADVLDNAFLVAGEIDVDAPVHGDLFVTGGDVRVRAPVHGDVYAVGGQLEVTEAGSVDGHVLAWGGEIEINGPVGGGVTIGAGNVELNAPIAGDVRVEAGELSLGAQAHLGGDLDYETPRELAGIDEQVSGRIQWTEMVDEDIEVAIQVELEDEEEDEGSMLGAAAWWSVNRVWGYVSKLAVGLVLLGLGGSATGRVARRILEQLAQSLGLGFVTLAVLPVFSTLAVITVVPFPLGLLGFLVFGVALYLGQLAAAQALGDLLLKRFRPDAWGSPVLSLAIGLVPLVLLTSLPWVGTLAWLVATLFGVGAAWMRLREVRAG